MLNRTRTMSLAVALFMIACGEDAAPPTGTAGGASTAAGNGAKVCTDGLMSTPGSASDPCAAQQATCGATGKSYAACSANKWTTCVCMPNPVAAAVCGNGVVEAPELCDTTVGTLTCAGMGLGTGTLTCDSSCQLSVAMCVAIGTSTGGTGNTGGTGSSIGTAGSGGTGR
ncbi:MAG: hypothetical protein RL701_1537 [Pseudomonadota bacterium]